VSEQRGAFRERVEFDSRREVGSTEFLGVSHAFLLEASSRMIWMIGAFPDAGCLSSAGAEFDLVRRAGGFAAGTN
jgi:hypothetical protein